MSRVRQDPLFVEAPRGGRFYLMTRPVGAVVGGVLLAPPFAEELNKSRRMLSRAAQAFAADGWLVLQPDLLGCGDSAGDFGDASWQAWVDDFDRAWQYLGANCSGPRVLWSVRAGSLLVADWMAATGSLAPWLAWQPVSSGKQHLQQFLRLKGVSEMLNDADARATMVGLRDRMAAGEAVEVAGYIIAPQLAAGLDAAVLKVPDGHRALLVMIETSSAEEPANSPAMRQLNERFEAAGVPTEVAVVRGPSFWQTQEIEEAPELVERSRAALGVLSGHH